MDRSIALIADTVAPDADYAMLKSNITDVEQVYLPLAIGAINIWNQLQVGFRARIRRLRLRLRNRP